MPLQNRVTPTGDIIATPHRGLFTGNRGIIHDPATKTLAEKALVEPGVAHLRLRIPGLAAQGDGRAELDRAVLSRRGDRVRGRPSSVLLLPPRRRQPFSRGVGGGQRRQRMCARARSTPCCIASGWTAARSGCIRCRCRWSNCPTARWCRQGEESFLIVQGRALQWSMAGYRRADARARRRDAADAAVDVARVGCGLSAGAASECGGIAKLEPALSFVMRGLDAGIHDFALRGEQTSMAGQARHDAVRTA